MKNNAVVVARGMVVFADAVAAELFAVTAR
jgi:hypothetical protein